MTFPIGEFSRIMSLSIKSLRLYHEKEILVPAEVDPFTGYRRYSEADCERAKTIQAHKESDFTLARIKAVLDECADESDLMPQLEKKRNEIVEKIGRYQEVSRSLEQIIQQQRESTMKTESRFEVEEKELDTILVAGFRMKGKYSDVGKGLTRLAKKLGRHINGKAMTLYYDDDYKEEGADFEPCFPVHKGRDGDGIKVRELKG
jgi:DNA-binding transcriptional MerR regulator